MAQSLGNLLVNISADTTQLIQGFNRAEQAVSKTTKTMSYAVKGLIGAFVGLNTLDLAKNFTKQMDMITEANNKLLLSTKNTNDFITAQKELFKVAQRTNQGFSETVDLYSNLALSMGEMGKSQAEVIRTVETVNKAIAISGSNAQQSAAAVLQLGQAFGSGKLSGDELSSLTENSKGLVRAIADGMGVAVGQLKELGSQGKITSEVLYQALAKMASDVDEKFGNTNKSVAQGFNNLSNSVSVLSGQFGNAIGFGDGFADTLFKISNYLDTNKDDIINYGILTTATISKVVDNFLLLGADIKNTAELLLDSVGIMAFGALKSVATVLFEITKGLNDINLSSDESLANAKSLLDFADKGYTNFKQSAVNNIQDIDNAYLKANVSIEDRIKLMEKEYKFQSEKPKNIPLVDTSKKEIEKVKQVAQVKKQSLDEQAKYELEILDQLDKEYQAKIENRNDLIAQATQLIADPIDTINDKYMEMYNVIDGLFNEEQMQKFFKKWQDEVDKTIKKQEEYEGLGSKEWASNLKGQAKNIADVSNAFEDINKEQKSWEKFSKDNLATEKDKATHVNEQLKGYSNLAGAISGMFEEGSREAAVFQTAQMALALVEGTRAVLSAGTGDPYTAIPRMIAMGAMVSSLLGNIGVAFGMNTTSTTSDSFSSESANIGAGSVLGDTSKESESINNALSTLEDFAQPQYQTLLSMNNYLETIANNIGGVTSLLIRQGGFAFGEGYEGFDTGFKNNISLNDITLGLMSPIDSIISKIPVIGQVNDLFGSVVNSVLGGVFGKTSVSQSMTDSGIYFADQLLTQAIEDFNGSAYQTIQTTVTKKSWFSKSSSTTTNSYFQALDEETERQFSLVLDNLYNTVLIAGQALDSTQSQIENSLSDFVVSIGKISLKDKTGEEIQETLTAAFGEIGDDIAKTAFPLLVPFQQIGEGMFETLTRVATGMEEAEFYISRLGNAFDDLNYLQIINKQGDIGFEALLQSITAVEEATYPTNNGLLDIVENLDATAEELYTVYISLDELRDRLLFLGQVAQGLSSSMIYGAGSVEALDSGFNAFFENFLTDSEQLTYQTQQITDEFNKLGIALPATKDGFKQLLQSLDLTTESGQELYGRLIILSESFAEVADKTAESISNLEDELKQLTSTGLTEFSSGIDSIFSALKGLKDIATSFINSFSTSSLGNTREQIIQYNKLRKEFEGMFDSTGKLNANVTEKEAKDIYSELSRLGTSIGISQEDLQKDLVSQFETDLSKLDMSEEILKVDIVSGLGDLLGLNEEQIRQLQVVAKDGNISNEELQNIGGLSKSQYLELLSLNTNGLNVTDAQIQSLTDLSSEQKAQLIKANSDGLITIQELRNANITSGQSLANLTKMDTRFATGIKVTDAQIQSLTTVSHEQKAQLIKANSDGLITNNELKSINSLTQIQKDGILDFAKNSTLFSTEETLSSLNAYMKKQLEVLQKTQAEETEKLSKKTLTYGDYIGKQEQIDIANLLGVSYESAKPLIEQLQALSISKTPASDLQKIIGYTGKGDLDYDTTKANQLKLLAPYITGVNVGNVIKGVDTNITADKAAIAKQKAIEEEARKKAEAIALAESKLQAQHKASQDKLAWALGHFSSSSAKQRAIDLNALIQQGNYQGAIDLSNPDASGRSWEAGFDQIAQDAIKAQADLVKVRGYAVGAVNIPTDQIAQIHQKEMIIPATFAEGLRNGDLTLSGNMNNNLSNINFTSGIEEMFANKIEELIKYSKQTYDILDDVTRGNENLRVAQI